MKTTTSNRHSIEFLGLLGLLLLLSFSVGRSAEAAETVPTNQLIILADCSNSMNSVDAAGMVRDSIIPIAGMLPEGTEVGVVAYQNDVISFCAPTGDQDVLRAAANTIGYAGYSNAGSGLEKALSLFSPEPGGSCRILLLSDGEIAMPGMSQTQESVVRFQNALKQAQAGGITIDVFALGSEIWQGAENIYSAAETTGGRVINLPDTNSLCMNVYRHLSEQNLTRLGERYGHLGTVEPGMTEIDFKLPDAVMDQTRLLIIGESTIPPIEIGNQADAECIFREGAVAFYRIYNPVPPEFTIHFAEAIGGNAEIYFDAEYHLKAVVETSYLKKEKRTRMNVKMVNYGDEQYLLPTDSETERIRLQINGMVYEGDYQDGMWEVILDGENKVNLSFEADSGYAGVTIEQPVIVTIPLKDRMSLLPIYLVLTVLTLFCIGLVWYYLHKKKREEQNEEKRREYFPEEPENIERPLPRKSLSLPKPGRSIGYSGKLNIYVIQSEEQDIPPQSMKLHGREAKEILSLEDILNVCRISFPLQGSDRILFYPGEDHQLVLCNYGPATVLKKRSLLLQGEKYPLFFREKITIVFEENGTELEVHYNNIKPSER